MLKLSQISYSFGLSAGISAGVALAALGFLAACSEQENVANGVSEETNTLAGILYDGNGNPVSGTCVMARHFTVDSIALTDTTDENGKFELSLRRTGRYGVSAKRDSTAYYETVDYEGSEISIEGKLVKSGSIRGAVSPQQEGIEISLPGSPWTAVSDSNGEFVLEGIPVGQVTLVAKSPDPILYSDAYYVANAESRNTFQGPFPKDVAVGGLADRLPADSASGLEFSGEASVIHLPLSREYGLRSWWSMDLSSEKDNAVTVPDVRGWTEGLLVYGNATFEEGVENKALALHGADQYGVVENDRGILDSATALVLEAWVKIDSVMADDSVYRKNVIGKLGFGSGADQDVFSLAVIDGECGAESPRLAFFLADGSGDSLSCANAVVASYGLSYGAWVYVTAVWNGESLKFYLDGKLSSEKDVSVGQIRVSPEPIFFGKETINLWLDDVRLGVKAIDDADVLYRYYLKEVEND